MQLTREFSDAALVQAFLQGQERAIEILITRYKDKIYTAIFKLVRDKYIAEDLFQESFLKMIRVIRQGRYSEQGRFLPWAMRIARNLCMDHFRRVQLRKTVTLPQSCDFIATFPLAESPEDVMQRREIHDSVRQLIDRLPEEQREVIILRMYGDLSSSEISAITNVSINTAKGRLRYALINLRKMMPGIS